MSVEDLKACLVKTKLNEEQMKQILMNHGVGASEAEGIAATLAVSQAEIAATASTGALTTATGGLSAAFRGLTVAMASNPIGAIAVAAATVIGVVSTAVTVFSNWSNSIEDVADSANDLKKSFDDIDSYISKINDLKTALNYDSISQTEATEKRKQLLEIQEELIKKYGQEKDAVGYITESIQGETSALIQLKKEAAKNWNDTHVTETKNANQYFNGNSFLGVNWGSGQQVSSKKWINQWADENGKNIYIMPNSSGTQVGFSGTIDEILANMDEFHNAVETKIKEYESKDSLNWYEQQELQGFKKLKSEILETKSELLSSDEYKTNKTIYDTAVENLILTDDKYSEYYEKIVEKKKAYTEALASGNQDEITQAYTELRDIFHDIFNLDFVDEDNVSGESIKNWFADVQKQVYQQSKETPIIVDVQAELEGSPDGYSNKIKEIVNKNNYTSDDINSILSKGDLNYESLSGDEKNLYDNIKGYIDLWNGMTDATGQAEITVEQYIGVLEKLGIVKAKVAEKNDESSFALSKDQTKELKSVHSDVDKLNKAYQNLFAGKLTTNDVAELVDLFPTLGEYVDWTDEKFGNLAEGIDKVIKERPADLIKQLEDVLNTQDLSDEAKKSIQSMIAALKRLKPELKDTKTLIEDIQKAIKGVSSSISTLIGFTKEISSDGALSLSSIDTIMTDDTYKSLRPYINDMEGMQTAITELVAKQKDAYEDLYNAEMYNDDVEAYQKAVREKEKTNSNLLADSLIEIQNEIKEFEKEYDVDLSNWDKLSTNKQNVLANTNAELLSHQQGIVDDFYDSYKTDLKNFKNINEAKMAIAENFKISNAGQAINDFALKMDRGRYHAIDWNLLTKEQQKEANKQLSDIGWSYSDYEKYVNSQFKDIPDISNSSNVGKRLDELIKPYLLDTNDWDKMTANTKSTGSSSSSSSSKNYIDWIERRLKKFAQTTKEVFAKVADYITFNSQNSQLRKAINAIRDEISVNEQSYQYYMEEANKVGLDPYWQWFVQNGARNISDIQDEVLREKINRYKELYDQAIDCKNAVEDLKKTEKEYANQMLSNVEKYYSNRIEYANADAEYYNSLDTDNVNLNKNFDAIRKSYNSQIAYTQKEHDDLLNTLNSLVSSGSIKYQSDEWYEWWAKIQKCNVEVRNLKKSIHDLANEELQNIQGYWDNRISVYDNTVSYLNAVGGDSTRKGSKDYKGLSSAYNTQIGYTNKQVSELQARLDKAVKAGDIEKYSDKWYEWIGIIEQGKEKVVELQTSINQLAVEQFEEIQKNYDNQLNLYEHTAKEYENKNKEIETRGLLANSKYYSKLQENEKNNISILKNQAKDLEDSLNQAVKSGNIEVGSEEWYKMRDAILSVNEQIDESNIKLLEYAKTIREIGWEVFSFLQDRISQLTTESDFLIDLMSNSELFDDSGNITAKGRATMGLHTQNYNVYMAQTEQYAAEIRKVNAQLAKDPHNTDIIKHREELLGLQQKSILAAEKEKKAIVDLTKQGFDEQLKSLKKLIEAYTKNLDAAKSLYDYQKNINEKTSNISKLQKQLNAYQGDNSEETQARIQQLQTELKEAQEDLQQTEYEKLISDTKSLLDDLYDDYEETLNNRLDNVDTLVSDMIGVVNDNSGDIKTTIESSAAEVGAILSKEITDIWSGKGAVNGNIVSNYYNGFDTKLTSVQTTLNNISSYVSILAKAGESDVKTTTSNTSKKTSTTTTKKPSTPQGSKSTTSTSKVSTPSGTSTGKTNSSTGTNGSTNTNKSNTSSKGNTSNSNSNSTKTRTDKENYGVALAIINGNYGWGAGEVRKKNLTAKGFNYNTVQGIVNKLWKEGYVKTGAWKGKYYGISDLSPYAYKKFKSGGLVDYTGLAQVDGTPMKPESFLNADDTENIANLRDTLRELAARPITMANGMGALGMFGGTVTPNILDLSQKLQALSGSDMVQNLNIHNENHIEIGIDKVEDYNDFITKMQKDRKFESIIQDMTFGRMNGGSSLAKYRH